MGKIMCRFVGELLCRFTVLAYYIKASFLIDKNIRGANMKAVINKFRVGLEINL